MRACLSISRGRLLVLVGLAAAFGLAGCFTTSAPPVSNNDIPPTPPATVPAVVPDAPPRAEARSRRGNPPFYTVFGKRYYVLSSSAAYVERGVASWYGPGFHKVQTSTGERYDMYGMTAAHKTLPLPAYVSVTNLQNGRSVVVRVNDRGPFVGNRIIDLSYTAASRLDMLRNGTAMVEVRALDSPPTVPNPGTTLLSAAQASPSSGQAGAAASTGAVSAGAATAPGTSGAATPESGSAPSAAVRTVLFVQAGAFADPANAEHLAAKLRGGGYGKIFVRDDLIAGRKMYRVRIGPVPDVPEFDRIVAALERSGVHDAHLALD
ncbi:MAG: rare lipoprotein [Gammaproteobacteria bacterium]|nr:rare lipoprotein [Gammaproteobacteria bacterium]